VIGWLEHPLVKWFLPVPLLVAIAPIIVWFFRGTWRTLEADALTLRQELAAEGRVDWRPLVTLTLGAMILVMQEYYGHVSFFVQQIGPFIARVAHADRDPNVRSHLGLYSELYGRMWWGLTRVAGYLTPYVVWRFAFPRDSLRDLGLRFAGFREHAWLYAFFVVVMVPILLLVSRQPDFGAYYPICSTAGRSWVEFGVWETVYVAQFVGLEMFFRGWWIRTTRIFGTGAIFSMIVPYVMIHFGKPYLEACAALVAGVILGSLSIRTRSIWAGVSVHVTVAILMDVLSLDRKGQLPTALTATSSHHFHFAYWHAIIWIAWGLALLVLAMKGVRMLPRARRV
jgi:membrane protease YdiL (CAAX protease family)